MPGKYKTSDLGARCIHRILDIYGPDLHIYKPVLQVNAHTTSRLYMKLAKCWLYQDRLHTFATIRRPVVKRVESNEGTGFGIGLVRSGKLTRWKEIVEFYPHSHIDRDKGKG